MDSIPQRRCNRCKQEKPATLEFFTANRSCRGDGLRSLCKTCTRAADHERWVRDHPRDILPDGYKRCTDCNEVKPATTDYFYVKRNGLTAHCKLCKSKRDKVSYHKHLEKRRARGKAYREENKEILRAKGKAFYHAHPEKMKAWNREYLVKHRETIRQRNRNQKAQRRGATGKHTRQDIQNQYKAQKGKCYWCDEQLAKFEVDHIVPISRGGSNEKWNIVLACPACNKSRGNRLPHEWQRGRLL